MSWVSRCIHAGLAMAFLLAGACQPGSPQVGSQTNWLKACDDSDDCGSLECICGTCTVSCTASDQCAELDAGACVDAMEAGIIALCDGKAPSNNLCSVRCDDASCPDGSSCVAGVCAPSREPTALVIVEPSVRHQTLVGFGASLAFGEDLIVGHSDKNALFDAMFSDSGFDVLRVGNRFDGEGPTDLQATSEIIAEAATRLGREPTVFMTSGSPPASLKANGSRTCINGDPNCTLARNTEGAFDYAGFAEYWRATLEAYAAEGIVPEFVSIQNNVDWIPPDEDGVDACRFLPEEGTETVTTADGEEVTAEFPSYVRALQEVQTAVAALDTQYSFVAPEVGSAVMVERYVEFLSGLEFDGLAFHLYSQDPQAIAEDQFEALRVLGEEAGKPLFQTEMAEDGLDTAILAHATLALANGAAYVQQPFVAQTMDEASSVLIGVEGNTIRTLPAYHALAHYARTTGPGWQRVDATSDASALLASGWLSPDETSLTLVLLNPTDAALDVDVTVVDTAADLFSEAEVTRTVFDGDERSANLGQFSVDHPVRVPARSIVTVATAQN